MGTQVFLKAMVKMRFLREGRRGEGGVEKAGTEGGEQERGGQTGPRAKRGVHTVVEGGGGAPRREGKPRDGEGALSEEGGSRKIAKDVTRGRKGPALVTPDTRGVKSSSQRPE